MSRTLLAPALLAALLCLLPRATAHRHVKKIGLEEHVGFNDSWPLFNDANCPFYGPPFDGQAVGCNPSLEWFQNQHALLDLDQGRIHDRIATMDEAGIRVMVLSMTGNTQDFSNRSTAAAYIRHYNSRLADAVALYPTRLKFWCILPMFDVAAAIAELTHCMQNPACPGALINGFSTDGSNSTPNYYNTPEYDPFWTVVQQLGALIYFHPRPAEGRALFTDFPELVASPWGFSMETAEHMLRFILQGFFDRFPNTTFIIGHNGEMLAYWANRINHRLSMQGWVKGVKPVYSENGLHARNYTVQEALRRHFYVTTSGMFNDAGLAHVVAVMGVERVMFSVDAAYESAAFASDWFERATAHMKRSDQLKLAYGNAARLLGIE